MTRLFLLTAVTVLSTISLDLAEGASDQQMSQWMVGQWQSPRHEYQYRSDRTWWMLPMSPDTTNGTWAFRGGKYIQTNVVGTTAYKVIAMTPDKLTFTDGKVTFVLTRMGKAGNQSSTSGEENIRRLTQLPKKSQLAFWLTVKHASDAIDNGQIATAASDLKSIPKELQYEPSVIGGWAFIAYRTGHIQEARKLVEKVYASPYITQKDLTAYRKYFAIEEQRISQR